MHPVKLISALYRLADQGALAPAYLLTGPDSEAKAKIAHQLCLYLNCENTTKPCGTCLNCKWIGSSSHPNTPLYLRPQEDSKRQTIKVEDAEILQAALAKGDNVFRVVIIEDATSSCFKTDTANKLLKTIEEPASNTVFMLFAPDSELVLSTIVSRAQEIYVDAQQTSESKTLSEEAQALYDKYAESILKPSSRLDLMIKATELGSAERETLIEFFEAVSDRSLKLDPLNLTQRIEAIEQIKTDIKNFVKADMAIYHALK